MEPQKITQVVYRFDHDLYRCFKAACLRRNLAPNVAVAAMVERQMREWGESMALIGSEVSHDSSIGNRPPLPEEVPF